MARSVNEKGRGDVARLFPLKLTDDRHGRRSGEAHDLPGPRTRVADTVARGPRVVYQRRLDPRLPIRWAAVMAELFSLTVELSRLCHAVWIDRFWQIRSAALRLGHGFLWSDLVCYGAGIGIGVLTEALSARRPSANYRPGAL